VKIKEINHRSSGQSIDAVSQDAAGNESQCEIGAFRMMRFFQENPENIGQGCNGDDGQENHFPLTFNIGKEAEGDAPIGGVRQAEKMGDHHHFFRHPEVFGHKVLCADIKQEKTENQGEPEFFIHMGKKPTCRNGRSAIV